MKYTLTLFLCVAIQFTFAQFKYINPLPGSERHNPETGIILKNGDYIDRESVQDRNFIEIFGSISGKHEWTARLSDDNKTIVIKPVSALSYSETVFVTVQSALKKKIGEKIDGTSFTFKIRNVITPEQRERYRLAPLFTSEENEDVSSIHKKEDDDTFPLDSMPTYKILVNNNPAPGQIFFCSHKNPGNTGEPGINSFPTIINNDGSIVWARNVGDNGTDFKVNQNGYLTYFDTARWRVMDSNFNIIETVQCTNGYELETNSHDFMMYPDGHVFLIAKDEITMDLTAYGGIANATVTDVILQELDANRDLVFQWRGLDHFQVTDANAYTPLTNAYLSYCHCNSIEKDYDGNILISSRNMNEVTKIDHETGNIIWRLGGDNNQFTFVNDNITEHFHSQHDARRLANGNIMLYNNGNSLPVLISSAKEYALDEVNKVATLVWYYEHPDINGIHVYSGATGSAQRLPNGNTIIDWGLVNSYNDLGLPNFTEVDPDKNIVWEMKFDSIGYKSYRVHKYEWNPCSRITGYTMNVTVKPTQVSLKWQPANGAKKYEINYRKASTSAWTGKNTGRTILKLTDLLPGTKYEWRVKTICSNDGSVVSGFSETRAFKTKPLKLIEDEYNEMEGILIYPVPASDFFTIDMIPSGKATIIITNTLGAVVYKSEMVSEEISTLKVDAKQWVAGIYIVTVKVEAGLFTRKILLD